MKHNGGLKRSKAVSVDVEQVVLSAKYELTVVSGHLP